ncbi:flagellar protein, FliL [Methanobrevibacter sp.]|uniref:flagellar protein, FliL n=1 Tax=Methanobrevibacter sp. TaxID=66852 RepID=UPI0038668CBE
MKGFILLILGIIVALLVIGGVAAVHVMHEMGIEDVNADTVKTIMDKVLNIHSSESSGSSSGSGSSSDSGNVIDVVKEEVKQNFQNGEGSYKEVTYKDGGFRQYDTETGELIGSSYDSDQDKLPSME